MCKNPPKQYCNVTSPFPVNLQACRIGVPISVPVSKISFSDEPSQPGRPNILDWGPNHCDLNWALPETDGGSPITHYVIELKVGLELFILLLLSVTIITIINEFVLHL